MQILQRRVYQLISSSASSAQRLLSSDKLRKRKWVLPSFASEKPVRSETRTSPSKPTVKKPDIQQADAIHNPKLEPWALRRIAIKNKYPEGWRPVRRISPEAVDGIRVLHKQVWSISPFANWNTETTLHYTATCRTLQNIAGSHSTHFKKQMAPIP